MIVINFSHPLSKDHIDQIEEISQQTIEEVIEIAVQFDNHQPFAPQLDGLLSSLSISAEDWQQQPILINPPSLNFITALLLAELHGRMGYFAPILRTRPIAESLPPRYEVAEILNLQAIRDQARKKRY